jgi:hypothetical protein
MSMAVAADDAASCRAVSVPLAMGCAATVGERVYVGVSAGDLAGDHPGGGGTGGMETTTVRCRVVSALPAVAVAALCRALSPFGSLAVTVPRTAPVLALAAPRLDRAKGREQRMLLTARAILASFSPS